MQTIWKYFKAPTKSLIINYFKYMETHFQGQQKLCHLLRWFCSKRPECHWLGQHNLKNYNGKSQYVMITSKGSVY